MDKRHLNVYIQINLICVVLVVTTIIIFTHLYNHKVTNISIMIAIISLIYGIFLMNKESKKKQDN